MTNSIAASQERLMRRRRLCLAMAGLLTPLPAVAEAPTWELLMNRWKQDQYLNIQNGQVATSQIAFTWWSAHWDFIAMILGTTFMRQKRGYFIQNRWKDDHFLHIEDGVLKAGPIQPGSEAAFWALESVGDNFFRIRNHERADFYLQIDAFDKVAVGPVPSGYWSGHWRKYAAPG